MKEHDTDKFRLRPDRKNLDDLIRQHRETESKKEAPQEKFGEVAPEFSSFILQHYERVLILERNEAAGEAVFRLLKAEGYNVEWETEREAAIEILENEEFSTLLVSEGFSADGLLILDKLKEKGIQVNLRVIKDFGTAILGHEETSSLKQIRRSFHFLTEFTLRLLESFHPTMIGHSREVARIAREVCIRMELLPETVDGVTIAAYLHELPDLEERYRPFWQKNEDLFEDGDFKLPKWQSPELFQALQYPFPIQETIKHLQERYDGKGYPDGLRGEAIPVGARIIAPIDIFLTMTSGISTGPTMSKGEALDLLIVDSGTAFDPTIIEILAGFLKKELTETSGTEYREIILMVDKFGEEDLPKIQLREEGYRVYWSDTVQGALKQIEETKPFMIISDVDLTAGDGFQLLDIIRKKTDFKDMPFFLLSTRSDSSFVTKGLRGGADDYLIRPTPADLLLAKVARNITRMKTRGGSLAERKGVTGMLRDLGILEIIQILAAGMKTAMIVITRGASEARVALTEGRISYANIGELEGEEAFYHFIGWDDGEFTIFMNVTPPKENIHVKNDMLLLEGFRRLDERRR